MTFLLLGGTGKTATRIAASLANAKKPFLLASRRGPDAAPKGYPAIKFDWADESTWSRGFENGQVLAVYMMEPHIDHPWVPMIKFVDLAKQKGVQRFVLCAGTSTALGKDGMGRVWEHFINSGVEYAVLRPTWFMGMYSCTFPPLILSCRIC
jgi:festuclavine dehydrogenase